MIEAKTARWRGGVLAAAAVAMMLMAHPSSAQTPVTVTIEEAVRRGLDEAPRLAEARAKESAARSTLTAQRALALPSANVSSSYARANHIDEVLVPVAGGGTRVLFPDITDYYRLRGELLVPVYAFGRVSATVDAARSNIEAATSELRATEANVRLDVTRAYWLVVTAREIARVIEQSQARMDASVADVRARVDAGVLPPNDLLSAQAQRARHQVRLIQVRNEAAFAEMDLARLIGERPGTPLQLTSPADRPTSGIADLAGLSPDDLVALAMARRPERAVLSARSNGLRSSALAAIANLRPYITALAAVEPARPNARFVPPIEAWRTSWALGVNVAWPFFDSGRSRAEHAGLSAQADAVEARRDELDGLVAIEVRQHLLDLESGLAAIAASAEAVAAAAEALRVVQERFRAGVATSTEVLDAQVALVEAEVERKRLETVLRMNEARLLRAVGGQ